MESILLICDTLWLRWPVNPVLADPGTEWIFIITMVNIAFILYVSFSAILNENLFELYVFLFYRLLFIVRVVFDIIERRDTCRAEYLEGYCFSMFSFVVLCNIAYFALVCCLKSELGWRFFKEVGVKIELKKLYSFYQAFKTMMKFDVVMNCQLVFTCLYFSAGRVDFTLCLGLSITLVVISIAWLYIGHRAVHKENVLLMRIFLSLATLAPAYAIYFIIYEEDKEGSFYRVLAIGLIAICVRVGLLISAVLVYQQFETGLLTEVFLRKHATQTTDAENNNTTVMVIEDGDSTIDRFGPNPATGAFGPNPATGAFGYTPPASPEIPPSPEIGDITSEDFLSSSALTAPPKKNSLIN